MSESRDMSGNARKRSGKNMDDIILTVAVIGNGVVSLIVLYFVIPVYTLKGKLCVLINTINSHDRRIQGIEERI